MISCLVFSVEYVAWCRLVATSCEVLSIGGGKKNKKKNMRPDEKHLVWFEQSLVIFGTPPWWKSPQFEAAQRSSGSMKMAFFLALVCLFFIYVSWYLKLVPFTCSRASNVTLQYLLDYMCAIFLIFFFLKLHVYIRYWYKILVHGVVSQYNDNR